MPKIYGESACEPGIHACSQKINTFPRIDQEASILPDRALSSGYD